MTNDTPQTPTPTSDPNEGAALSTDVDTTTNEDAKTDETPTKKRSSRSSSSSSTTSTKADRKPAPVTDAQHVTLRAIEGGHVRRTSDDSYALPENLTDASVTAVIGKGLAEHGDDAHSVKLTEKGAAYLAGRDA